MNKFDILFSRDFIKLVQNTFKMLLISNNQQVLINYYFTYLG